MLSAPGNKGSRSFEAAQRNERFKLLPVEFHSDLPRAVPFFQRETTYLHHSQPHQNIFTCESTMNAIHPWQLECSCVAGVGLKTVALSRPSFRKNIHSRDAHN